MFGWDFEVDASSRFWKRKLIKFCVRTCDMNSTLGSVVPLAMFILYTTTLMDTNWNIQVIKPQYQNFWNKLYKVLSEQLCLILVCDKYYDGFGNPHWHCTTQNTAKISKIVYSLEKIFDGEKRFKISSNFSGFRIKKTGIRPRGKIYWALKRAKSAFEIEVKITETF